MKLLTKHTDYAVRALAYLAMRPGKVVPSREIAAQEQIPLQFTRRILQVLTDYGFVDAREGVAGGICLKKPAGHIRILDIMTLFQGDFNFSECMFRNRPCKNRATCPLRGWVKRIESMVLREFRRLTLADLIPGRRAH